MNADQVAPRPLAVKRRNEDHQRPMASKIVAVLPLLSRFGGKATTISGRVDPFSTLEGVSLVQRNGARLPVRRAGVR